MSAQLSPEIIDEIIDHLHEDTAALAACGLVCKAWVAPSRYHLFGKLILIPVKRELDQLLDILEFDNGIAPFIRHISLYNLTGYAQDLDIFTDVLTTLRDIAPAFKSVRTRNLSLSYEQLFECLPLNRVTRWDISSCAFETTKDLPRVLSELPCLEILIMEMVGWTEDRASYESDTVYLPSLRRLETYGSNNLEKLLAVLEPVPTLCELLFSITSLEEFSAVGDFIEELRPNLKTLELSIRSLHSPSTIPTLIEQVDLQTLKGLRFFHLDFSMEESTVKRIPDVIDQIDSPAIERLKFTLFCAKVFRNDIWTTMPIILSKPTFRRLQKLEFCMDESRDCRKVEEWIRWQLRGFQRQEILYIRHPPVFPWEIQEQHNVDAEEDEESDEEDDEEEGDDVE